MAAAALIAAIPALIGAFGPALSKKLFGEDEGEFKQISTQTPEQQQLFSQLLGGLGGLQGQGFGALQSKLGGSQDFLSQLQAPALRQFQEQTIPNIAERFSGLGAQGSSAFGQQLGSAGAGLAEKLAAQRGELGMQSQQQGLEMLLTLLGLSQKPQFQSFFDPGRESPMGGFLGGVGTGFGGAFGKVGGEGLSSALSGLFKKKPGIAQNQLAEGAYGLYPTGGFQSLA